MSFQVVSLIALFILPGFMAVAQNSTLSAGPTNQLKTRTSDLEGNKKFEENRQITDTKLRAEEGSFSRYSIRANLDYYGPPVGQLDAADQPNPDKAIGPYSTSLGGSISGRYRLSSASALSMGSGLKLIHPLHNRERFDVNSPYARYEGSRRVGNLQWRTSGGVGWITDPNFTKVGEYGSLGLENSFVQDLGTSGFALALDLSTDYFLYNRGYQDSDALAARYSLAMTPGLKYNLSDKLSLNTSWKLNWLSLRLETDQSKLKSRTITQRLGAGYAFRRDIYFAPYLMFYPNRIAAETTTLNISTIFSLL